ncbi:MAG: tyrosine-type recombinase/integrase [Aeromonas sobria]
MPSSSPTKRAAITDASIKRHQPDKDVRQLSEPASSLVFRYSLRDREKGSFHLRHYQNGEERWALVGRYPDITSKQARTIYRKMKETLFLTPDARALIDRLTTMGDLLQWYQGRVERNNEITKARRAAVVGIIENHLIPPLNQLDVTALSKAQLDRVLIQPLLGDYSPSYVRGIMVILKQATKAALALDLLTFDPLAGWSYKDFTTARVRPKAPKLNQTDLRGIIDTMPPVGRTRLLIQLMLSWGTRIGETAELRWKWLDLEARMLRIPANFTKTGVQHDLPLTVQVIQILGKWKGTQRKNATFVFPGQSGKALDVSQHHKEIKAHNRGEWTSHELRKLARTLLTDQGVEWVVGERILNHAQKDLDKTYNAALMEAQKLRALTVHSDEMEQEGLYL